MSRNLAAKWLALSALTALLAFASAPARAHDAASKTGASTAHARADQDFSAKAKYAKKQTDTWARTKKYR